MQKEVRVTRTIQRVEFDVCNRHRIQGSWALIRYCSSLWASGAPHLAQQKALLVREELEKRSARSLCADLLETRRHKDYFQMLRTQTCGEGLACELGPN